MTSKKAVVREVVCEVLISLTGSFFNSKQCFIILKVVKTSFLDAVMDAKEKSIRGRSNH